jgi:hypothetical protein
MPNASSGKPQDTDSQFTSDAVGRPDKIAEKIAANLERWLRDLHDEMQGKAMFDNEPTEKRKWELWEAVVMCFPMEETSILDDWLRWHKPEVGKSLVAKREALTSNARDIPKASGVCFNLCMASLENDVMALMRTLRHTAVSIREEAAAEASALPRLEDGKADSTKQGVPGGASQITVSTNEFDAFLCHASEDKKAIVEPFADAMERAGLNPWLDKDQGKWGDGLIHRIQNGLARSRFVVVFVSAAFLGKGWPEKELEAALSMEMGGRKVVLPILLGLTHAEVEDKYPMVASKLYEEVPGYAPGKRVSKKIIAAMVDELKDFIS